MLNPGSALEYDLVPQTDVMALDLKKEVSLIHLLWHQFLEENIPILPEAFLTFASKGSVGPSKRTRWQRGLQNINKLKWWLHAESGVLNGWNLTRNRKTQKPVQTLKRPPLQEGPKSLKSRCRCVGPLHMLQSKWLKHTILTEFINTIRAEFC